MWIYARCLLQEDKLSELQAGDVRLNPGFKACSEEMAVYCKQTEPGRGRMFRCLQSNLGKVDFSSQCKEQVPKTLPPLRARDHPPACSSPYREAGDMS